MAKCFVCAVGGTGSRIGSALMNTLLAGGCDGSVEELHILSIDADVGSNDTNDLAQATRNYEAVHSVLLANAGFANVPVSFYRWQPTANTASLEEMAGSHANPLDDEILNALYSRKQQEVPVNNVEDGGFRANPNIGVCFMRAAMEQTNSDYQRFQAAFQGACANAGNIVRLVIAGSLFGGTGASAFISIAASLKSIADGALAGNQNFRCAAVMMTPYFRICDENGKPVPGKNEFYASSREALAYYIDHAHQLPFHNYYLMGSPVLRNVIMQESNQQNPFSFVEAEAAEAVLDFCAKPNVDVDRAAAQPAFYKQKGAVYEEDAGNAKQLELNHFGRSQASLTTLLKMARFCLNYLYVVEPYYRAHEHMLDAGKSGVPDYASGVFHPMFAQAPELRKELWIACENYLKWLLDMLRDQTFRQSVVDMSAFGSLCDGLSMDYSAAQERYAHNRDGVAENAISYAEVPYRKANQVVSKLDGFRAKGNKALDERFANCLRDVYEMKAHAFVRVHAQQPVMAQSSLPLLGVRQNAALGLQEKDGYYPTLLNTIAENIGELNKEAANKTGAVPDVLQPDFRMRKQLLPLREAFTGSPSATWASLAEETKQALKQALALRLLISRNAVAAKTDAMEQLELFGSEFAKVIACELRGKGITAFTRYIYPKTGSVIGYGYEIMGAPMNLGFAELSACPAARMDQPFAEAPMLKLFYLSKNALSLPLGADEMDLPAPSAGNAELYASLAAELAAAKAESNAIAAAHAKQKLGEAAAYIGQRLSAAEAAINARLAEASAMQSQSNTVALVRSWLLDEVAVAIGGNFFGMVNLDSSPYTLPLSDAFWAEYDAAQGVAKIALNIFAESIRVEDGGAGDGCVVRCQYNGMDCQFTLRKRGFTCAPAMVWPPEPCDAWSKYYLYSQAALDPTKRMYEDWMWLRVRDVPPAKNRSADINGSLRGEVTELSAFPTRFDVINVNGARVGSVLLKQPRALDAGSDSAIVGIDFGSTNTTVAYSTNGANYQLLKLSNGVRKICDGDGEVETLLNFHIDAQPIPEIFMTILNDHRADTTLAHNGMATGTIPFTSTLTPNTSEPLFSRFRTNLKFNSRGAFSGNNKLNCDAFLERLFSEIKWALLKKNVGLSHVTYCYAVPSSMDQQAIGNIDTIMETKLPHPSRLFEAEAVGALVLDNLPASVQPSSGFGCIDIGGGSIDISIWQAPEGAKNIACVGQLSMNEVAGKGLMRWIMRCSGFMLLSLEEAMRIHYDALTRAGVPSDMEQYLHYMHECAVVNNLDQFNTYYNARAEAIWMVYKQAELDDLSDDTTPIARCKRGIRLYFCMLAYFVGQMVGTSIAGGKMRPWPNDPARKFELFFAGNGSKFMQLADEKTLKPLLEKSFFAGMNKECDACEGGLVVSGSTAVTNADYKHEVAKGLCCHFNNPKFTPISDHMPAQIPRFEDAGLNFDADSFTAVFGKIESNDPNNCFEVCARTDVGEKSSYDKRFRDMLEKVLTNCDLR